MVGLAVGIVVSAVVITVVLWVNGITYMNENHPEYKGEDLFNEEEDDE